MFRGRQGWVLFGLCLIGAGFLTVMLVWSQNLHRGMGRFAYIRQLDHTGEHPFVRRTLVPTIIRLIDTATPESVKEAVADAYGTIPPIEKATEKGTYKREHFFRIVVGYVSEFISLLLYQLALMRLGSKLGIIDGGFTRLLPMLSLVGMVPFLNYHHIYDFPALLLSTFCLTMMLEQRFGYYIAGFAVATVNKEISFVLGIAFFLYHYRAIMRFRGKLFWLFLAQIAIYLGIVGLLLFVVFGDNPGALSDDHFRPLLSIFAPFELPDALLYLTVLTLTFAHWRLKPRFLKAALAMWVPMFLLYTVWGVPGEIRVFFEVYPVVFLAMAFSVRQIVEGGGPGSAARGEAGGVPLAMVGPPPREPERAPRPGRVRS